MSPISGFEFEKKNKYYFIECNDISFVKYETENDKSIILKGICRKLSKETVLPKESGAGIFNLKKNNIKIRINKNKAATTIKINRKINLELIYNFLIFYLLLIFNW